VLFTITCLRTTYAKISVVRHVLLFFVRAIHYQFVKTVLHTCSQDDHILFIERLLQWVFTLSRMFSLSVYI